MTPADRGEPFGIRMVLLLDRIRFGCSGQEGDLVIEDVVREIDVIGSNDSCSLAPGAVDVEADCHASGQGDSRVIHVRQEPAQAVVQPP